jgi:alkylation response protein AidB-like acyl-CoA dehydrogenase
MTETHMPDLEQFRRETRAWLEANCPAEMRRPMTSEEDTFWGGRNTTFSSEPQRVWFERMRDKGWTVPHWPSEYGGGGLDGEQTKILRQEMAAIGARQPLTSFGISMLGPALLKYGTDAQKKEHLPKITAGLIRWCQGYSEPNAGSDLASLQTRAESDGDHFIISGQKIWTSYANYADWIFCLVRTDPAAKKQEGISFILVDMKTPGITVRPIITIDGGREVNEVFFDNVEVPAENLVGQENKGWDYAKFLLGNERTGIARVGASKAKVARIKELASMERIGDQPLIEDPRFREKLAAVEIELKALEMTQLRVVADERKREKGKQNPASSILKLKGSVIQQQLTELLMEVVGPYVMPYQRDFDGNNEPVIGPDCASEAAPMYFNYRKVSIYGGSNEIQKNIIAKAVLGL